jgi:hypothetical protein
VSAAGLTPEHRDEGIQCLLTACIQQVQLKDEHQAVDGNQGQRDDRKALARRVFFGSYGDKHTGISFLK